MSATATTSQPFARVAAALGHFQNVRRVEVAEGDRKAKVYVVNNGLGFQQIKQLRQYGWKIVSISMRFNYVIIERDGGDPA